MSKTASSRPWNKACWLARRSWSQSISQSWVNGVQGTVHSTTQVVCLHDCPVSSRPTRRPAHASLRLALIEPPDPVRGQGRGFDASSRRRARYVTQMWGPARCIWRNRSGTAPLCIRTILPLYLRLLPIFSFAPVRPNDIVLSRRPVSSVSSTWLPHSAHRQIH